MSDAVYRFCPTCGGASRRARSRPAIPNAWSARPAASSSISIRRSRSARSSARPTSGSCSCAAPSSRDTACGYSPAATSIAASRFSTRPSVRRARNRGSTSASTGSSTSTPTRARRRSSSCMPRRCSAASCARDDECLEARLVQRRRDSLGDLAFRSTTDALRDYYAHIRSSLESAHGQRRPAEPGG